MTTYALTHFNYAYREMESEKFEAVSDDAAQLMAEQIAAKNHWVEFDLYANNRVVFHKSLAAVDVGR